MIVFALIGKSGSGKSHRAQYVSRDYNIQYIIDDGLLITGNRVVAGFSAKKEETRIAAVKRAIFSDSFHRQEVKDAIKNEKPSSILILGTSDHMIERIVENLELPAVQKKIFIEDIASPREMEMAAKMRKEQGKHVIPVPTFAIKKDFSGYFIDSIKNLTRKGREVVSDDIEKTVVRPTFSYLGKYIISNNVIKSLVMCAGAKVEGIHRVLDVDIENKDKGIILYLDVSIEYGYIIPEIINKLREFLKDEIEYMTSFNILEINVYVKTFNL